MRLFAFALAASADAWLLDAFRAPAPPADAVAAAAAAARALKTAGYTAKALDARLLGGTPAAGAAAPTQLLKRASSEAAPPPRDEVDALIQLFALGRPADPRALDAATFSAVAPLLVDALDGGVAARAMVAPVAVGALGRPAERNIFRSAAIPRRRGRQLDIASSARGAAAAAARIVRGTAKVCSPRWLTRPSRARPSCRPG